MKNISLTFLIFLSAAQAFAQKSTTIEIKINGEAADMAYWGNVIAVAIFTIIILILVLRTFRGKSEI